VSNGEAACLLELACFGDTPKEEPVLDGVDPADFCGGDPKAPGDPAFGPGAPNGEAAFLLGAACFGEAPKGENVLDGGDPADFGGGDPTAPGDPAF